MASVQAAGFLKAIRRTGFFDPATVAAFAAAAAMWGASSATPYAAAAARHPNRLALTDDYGSVSYRQLDWRTSRVAAGLRRTGIKRGASVGLLCRNHRGFVEANVALAKVGCPVIYLNTGLPKAQMDQVIEREGVTAVVADSGLVDRVSAGVKLIVAAPEDNPSWSFPDLGQPRLPIQFPRPWKVANPVLLTSGTSGAPRGTQRSPGAKASLAALGFLAVMPFSRGDVFVVPAPLFHAWGLSQLLLSSVLAGTVVLRNSFEPALAAADVEAHQASVLAAVPVMLSRILTAAPDADLSSLRITATSGSALPGQLGDQWMDAFGNNLHNLYGSTEVGQVSLADPRDLRAAPGTAGRALPGVNIRVVDAAGREIKAGKTGRIVVKSEMHFDGYTGGGSKELVEGYMDIGDDGYLDSHGRLFVAGRADQMIISGGENLYPTAIERCLLDHDEVLEAVVVGVPDDDLGQRVRAVIIASSNMKHRALKKALKTGLAARLATYEMPREYVFVSELPRNAAGKVLLGPLSGPSNQIPNLQSDSKKAKE